MFADPAWLYAHSTRPSGTAAVEGAGYRVRGRWALVSGCELAEWLMLLCRVERPRGAERGEPELRFAFLRRGEYAILDTWNSGGLRGSGSHDVAVEGAWVPEERAIAPGTDSSLSGPLGCVPIICNVGAGFAAQVLGIAGAALAEIVDAGRSGPDEGSAPGLRERPSAQAAVALHAAALEAARAHLRDCVEALWSDAADGGPPRLEAIGRVHAAARHANEVARGGFDAMYALGGTRSLYASSPLERAHRDLHAMLRHIVAQPLWTEQAGRVTFGLSPTEPLYAL